MSFTRIRRQVPILLALVISSWATAAPPVADPGGRDAQVTSTPVFAPTAQALRSASTPLTHNSGWLRQALAGRTVLGIGENTHGSANTIDAISAALASDPTLPVHWVAVEIDAYGARLLTRQMNAIARAEPSAEPSATSPSSASSTSSLSIDDLLRGIPEWPYQTRELSHLLTQVVDQARARHRSPRIHGLNASYPTPVYFALTTIAERAGCVDPREENETLREFGRRISSLEKGIAQQPDRYRAALDMAERRMRREVCPAMGPADAEESAFLVGYLRRYVDEHSAKVPLDARERALAQVVIDAAQDDDARCCGLVIAHNGHIGRLNGTEDFSMGGVLAKHFGSRYGVVLTTFAQGSFRAFHPKQGLTTLHETNLDHAGLEKALAAHLRGDTYVDLATLARAGGTDSGVEAPRADLGTVAMRNIGGFYFPEGGFPQLYTLPLTEAADGLLFIERLVPSRPLVMPARPSNPATGG